MRVRKLIRQKHALRYGIILSAIIFAGILIGNLARRVITATDDLPFYHKKATWHETMFYTRQAMLDHFNKPGKELSSPVQISPCFQNWQSCASCHPDVRADGLNWDLLNDGAGNPKNTKSLLLSMQTPPVMISGIRDRAETAVRSGFKYIQFNLPSEQNATSIDAYLRELKPIPSPFLQKGKLSKAAERGKQYYSMAGCASCHPGPLFTDMKKYDAGTGTGSEKNTAFDAPALIEVWRTAPYLYDGRAVTIQEVLMEYNSENKHGDVTGLNNSELQDLIEYILSL